jgi:large conductance mechanosensitive channel
LSQAELARKAGYGRRLIQKLEAGHLGRVEVGAFLAELLNFLVIAAAMYLVIVKVLGSVQRAVVPADPEEPATKERPLCLSVIPYKARRCAHCTADLPDTT